MERCYAKKDASNSNTGNKENRLKQKRPRIELDLRDIVDDPGNIIFFIKKGSLYLVFFYPHHSSTYL
jgi:hypothetical protein